MSVLIKGLSMPTACQFCPLVRFYRHVPNVWCNGVNKRLMTDYDGDPDVYIERPDWCPLVELPDKHGRLIDADAMKCVWMGARIDGDIGMLLDARPTIVESEGE